MIRAMCLAWGFVLCVLPAAWAIDYSQPFFPNFLDELPHKAQRIHRLPGRLNINLADLNQLMAIPTISENVALKIIRYRPYYEPSDLRRISSLSPNELERLIRITSTRFQFEMASGELLRQ